MRFLLHLFIPSHVVQPSLVMVGVFYGIFVQMLCQIWLAIIDFSAAFAGASVLLNGFLWRFRLGLSLPVILRFVRAMAATAVEEPWRRLIWSWCILSAQLVELNYFTDAAAVGGFLCEISLYGISSSRCLGVISFLCKKMELSWWILEIVTLLFPASCINWKQLVHLQRFNRVVKCLHNTLLLQIVVEIFDSIRALQADMIFEKAYYVQMFVSLRIIDRLVPNIVLDLCIGSFQ